MLFTTPAMIIMWLFPNVKTVHQFLMKSVYPPYHLSFRVLFLCILATPVQFGVGFAFYQSSYKSIRHGAASMDVLITLGSSAAYLYSIISIFLMFLSPGWSGNVFFETSMMLFSIVLFGRYIEIQAKGRTSTEISELMSLQPQVANLLQMDENNNVVNEEEINTNLLQLGDIVRVKAGKKIPADGEILNGKTTINEALVTGESLPVYKEETSSIIGGTVNLDSVIDFKVTKVGSNTVLAQIVKLVNDAQANKAPIQGFSDRVASIFVPIVVFISFLTFIVWFVLLEANIVPSNYVPEGTHNFVFSIMLAISVLVISCPCSLGLATPTAVMVGTMVGAKHGILFKGGEPLEICGKAKVVMFDKTGTLTMGQPSINISETHIFNKKINLSVYDFWRLMAGAESKSEHMLGRCIVEYFNIKFTTNIPMDGSNVSKFQEASEYKSVVGRGIKATVQEKQIIIGNQLWLEENNITVSERELYLLMEIQNRGNIGVLCSIEKNLAAIISISDQIKEDALYTVNLLQNQGIHVLMVTGDNRMSAIQTAKKLGIPDTNVCAQVKPNEKAKIVASFQEPGNDLIRPKNLNWIRHMEPMKVMYVGDGINDSPALAKADVGVAIGNCVDIASETASIICVKPKLTGLLIAIDLSRCTLKTIFRNYGWALCYNCLAIPFAAGLFYPLIQVTLPPSLAAMAMGFSSLSVVLSSLWLKRYQAPSDTSHKLNIYQTRSNLRWKPRLPKLMPGTSV